MSEASFVEVDMAGGVVVATATCNAIAQREAPIIEHEVLSAADRLGWKIVLDCSQVTMIGSVGLGMLITVMRRAKENGGALAVCGLSKDLIKLIKMTHLDKVLHIAKNQTAAQKAVR